jgi:hypothetical protein
MAEDGLEKQEVIMADKSVAVQPQAPLGIRPG